jgi:hypothetical protein
MKPFIKILNAIGGVGAILPWFFTDHLGTWAFWIAGGGYLLILVSNGMSSNAGWKWELALNSILVFGIALITLPLYLEMKGSLKIICFIFGFSLILLVGYNARMKLIGKGDPAWELWLETREKIKLLRKRNQEK